MAKYDTLKVPKLIIFASLGCLSSRMALMRNMILLISLFVKNWYFCLKSFLKKLSEMILDVTTEYLIVNPQPLKSKIKI